MEAIFKFFIEYALSRMFDNLFQNKILPFRFLLYKIIKSNSDIRISFSALLRIKDGNRYLLVRNLHRPELYAPFGGVYKYYPAAQDFLDSLSFRTQSHSDDDMNYDLRGFLPKKNILSFYTWYKKGLNRESPNECLRRELSEEISESLIENVGVVPDSLQVKLIRIVTEGPEQVAGAAFMQFRHFEIYDLDQTSPEIIDFTKKIINAAKNNPNLLFADANEIRLGRTSNKFVIGHNAVYLFSSERLRPDFPTIRGN